jgi:DNA-binding CsgD family transcriptional regulator
MRTMGQAMLDDNIDLDSPLGALTAKQREVLDLLIQHKTSKEIARRLEISPHTVDQRIEFAKRKLGARSRNELAVQYRQMVEIYDHLTYEFSRIGSSAISFDDDPRNEAEQCLVATYPNRTRNGEDAAEEADYRVVPEMFEGRYGTLARIGVIVALAALLVFVAVGGLALFSQLSEVFAS